MYRKIMTYAVAVPLALAATASVGVTGVAAQQGYCGGADVVVVSENTYQLAFIQTSGNAVRTCTVARFSDGNLGEPACGQWR